MFLGDLEKKIMDVVWASPESLSVRTVGERLRQKGQRYAYTTVMTTLTRLFQKGIVTRRLSGRGFLYTASETRADFFRSMGKNVMHSLTHEFGEAALAHFVEVFSEVDPAKLKKWKSLLRDSSL